jgi:hypothetical protein
MTIVERVYLHIEGDSIGLTPKMYKQMDIDIQNAIARAEKPYLAVNVTHTNGYFIYELDSDPAEWKAAEHG